MGTNAQVSLHPEWVCGLLEPDAYPHAVPEVQLIETHISWIFLTGQFAYKVKKPVDLGFVNFSTLELRQFFCDEELRLNRRTTNDLYLDVVPIGLAGGKPRIGLEPAMEYAVRMRQFAADARLDRTLEEGKVMPGQIRNVAELLAAFHGQRSPITTIAGIGAAERASQPALNNFGHIEGDHISSTSRLRINAIEAWTLAQGEALAPAFIKRAAGGFIRECHGDLHLANLFVRNGEIYPYDCLEFNEKLRCIDQVSDLSFLVMDLMARDRPDLAYALLNTWLEGTGDYGGLAVLRFYLVYRCMVRLKVASIQAQQLHEDARGAHAIKARHYLDLACDLMAVPDHPVMVLMHGFSASGKTWTSGKLATAMPAIRIRSDLERKRLHGLPHKAHSEPHIEAGLYSPDATRRTYKRIETVCETGLRNGFNMIADATFLQREQRSRFLDLAKRLRARPIILDCKASLETLRHRIVQRSTQGMDESDADLAVIENQMAHADPLDEDELRISLTDINDLALSQPGLITR